ncbi:NADH dehydrogenase [ubiquinone] 1 beta subcomplex subunit 6 [Narcine bancroftii]|uniref:NADH dehydrogenase [ubiquinone] 1 beta subcomplex subunit 6 n=1 Tax=Narcine bancroftii TaxID=1343680 RepID=UPI00383220BD
MPLGYTPEEKARFEQLVKLRRQWLKDQELSPREPVLPHDSKGPVAKFWENFLQQRSLWRIYTYKACNAGWWTLSRLLIPAWLVHYYVKYHLDVKPYGIVSVKPRIFPGDTILETGEVIPPLSNDEHPKHH